MSGLALAAGALGVVRMSPESVVGAMGSPDAEPTTGTGTDTAGNAAATVGPVPSGRPVSATTPAVMGRESALPPVGVSLAPTSAPTPTRFVAAPSTPVRVPVRGTPDATGIPAAPAAPAPVPTVSRPPAAMTAAPVPSATTPTADPRPRPPGLCVPVIGLCVDGLAKPLGGHGQARLPGP
ncbi:hypothetical protein [Streptomyces sp. NPDC127072]|uniref:hypothetical protein n=1 Tax=Streptomyces sp. NPDC127072 TaxID=3347129 RepID=UPI003661C258